ncbi:Transposon Tf2-9 poly, partial [Paramuricea clavata]
MDTDSAYLAISAESIDDIIKPEMQDEYESDKCDWFPRTDTVGYANYDKGTP